MANRKQPERFTVSFIAWLTDGRMIDRSYLPTAAQRVAAIHGLDPAKVQLKIQRFSVMVENNRPTVAAYCEASAPKAGDP